MSLFVITHIPSKHVMGILTSFAAVLASTECGSRNLHKTILIGMARELRRSKLSGFWHRSSASPSIVLLSATECSLDRWFFRCSGVITLSHPQLLVLLFQLVLPSSNYCSLPFLLLLIHQLFYFVDKIWQFTSFIINFSLEHGIDTFTRICGERLWRAAQSTFLSDRLQHRITDYMHAIC